MEDEPYSFDVDAYPHLLRLREALWASPTESRVSVMVGAGFSKNATPLDASKGTMPDWYGLATLLSRELTPDDILRKQIERDMGSVSEGYMRLAQYYEAKFGRPALDKFIRESIADALFEPSALHEKLLNLPWREVFTTNWDTLLERAADDLHVDRLYFPVTDDAQVLTAGHPRITKLHGCVRRGDNYVFTEEDYRQYPQRHPVFITIVRQALVEGPMVLFGFSGEDPNFRSWVGWMRDVLRSTQGIFLLDFSDHAAPEFMTRRLANQGVSVLNVGKSDVPIAKSVDAVLSFLSRAPVSNWPVARRYAFSAERIDDATQAYPGWLVCPRDDRHSLEYRLRFQDPIENSLSKLTWDQQLSFVANRMEFLDLIGTGISSEEAEIVDSVLKDSAARTLTDTQMERWLSLVFSRLTTARLDLDFGAYSRTRALLTTSPAFQRQEVINRLYLSDAVVKLVSLDRDGAIELVRSVKTSDPRLQLRALALRLEIEGAVSAQGELDNLKRHISRLVRERPTDVRYASLDDIIRFVERNVGSALDPLHSRTQKALSTDVRFEARLGMRCDVVGELSFLEAVIDAPPNRPPSGPKMTPSFSAGTYQKTLKFVASSSPAALLSAYLLARLPDDVGLPIAIGSISFLAAPLKNASKWLTEFDPAAGLSLALRLLASRHGDRVKQLSRHDVARLDRPLVLHVWSFTIDAVTRELERMDGDRDLLQGALHLAVRLVIRTGAAEAEKLWAAALSISWNSLHDRLDEFLRARADACVEASHLLPRSRVRELLEALARQILTEANPDEKLSLLITTVAQRIDMKEGAEHRPGMLDPVISALESADLKRRSIGIQMLSVMNNLFAIDAAESERIGDALWRDGTWPELSDANLTAMNRGFLMQWSGRHRRVARTKLINELSSASDDWQIVALADLLAWRDDDESFDDWRASIDVSDNLMARVLLAILRCAKERISSLSFGSVNYPRVWRNGLGRFLAPLHVVNQEQVRVALEDAKRSDLWAPSIVLELYRFGLVEALDLFKAILGPSGDEGSEWNRLDCIFEIIKSADEPFESLGDRLTFLIELSSKMTSVNDRPDTAHALWIGTRIARERPELINQVIAETWLSAVVRISGLDYGSAVKEGQVIPDLRRAAAALLSALHKAQKFDVDAPEVAAAYRSFAGDALPEVRREIGL